MAFLRVTHLAIGAALVAGPLNATARAQFSTSPPPTATAEQDDAAPAEGSNATTGAPGARGAAAPGQSNPRAPWDNEESRVRMLKARFTGLGGFGGRGGRGGGPGGAAQRPSAVSVMLSLLENSKILQEEIQLTEAQKEQIQTIHEAANERRRELFGGGQNGGRGNRGGGQGGQNNGGRGNRGGGQNPAALNSGGRILGVQNPGGQNPGGQNGGRGNRGGFGGGNFQAMRDQMNALNQETEAAILRILTKPQKTRLAQIALQIEGPLAVTRPDIAASLKLTDSQIQKLQVALTKMQAAQQEAMTAQMTKMRALFAAARTAGNPGGGPGGAPADQVAQNAGGRGGRNRFSMSPQMQEAMQTATKEAGELQDQTLAKTEAAINKLLTASQKKKIKAMLGPEFDVVALATEDTGRGGFGGFGGGRPGGPPATTTVPTGTRQTGRSAAPATGR